jgi:amidase
MGRCVADVALMLDAAGRRHPLDPLSYDAPARPYAEAVANPVRPGRVAWAAGFNGLCPLDPEIEEICRAATLRFAELGAVVEDKAPDAGGAREAFQVFRGHFMAASHGPLLDSKRDLLKPEVIWNMEYGRSLSSEDLRRAAMLQGQLYARFAQFMDEFDILATPAAPVPPFPVETRYVESINGQKMPSYIDWVLVTSVVTMTGLPSVSVPVGFTRSGLPVGLQLVGRPRGEAGLLAAAKLFEDMGGLHRKLPIDPVVRH